MATPDFGPVGGGIGAVTASGGLSVIQTTAKHGLEDRARVRIGAPVTNGTSSEVYFAKASGFGSNEFAVYRDDKLTVPVDLGVTPDGTEVVRLAFEDWAVVVGINFYRNYKSLEGAVGDARRFTDWLKYDAFVLDEHILSAEASLALPQLPDQPVPWLQHVTARFRTLVDLGLQDEFYRVGRRLYIFLSGHGALPTRSGVPNYDESALLMANISELTAGDHLAGLAYANWFWATGVFDEVVLFMDCCRDWNADIAINPPFMTVVKPKRDPGRRFYAMAAELDSKAWEKDFGAPAQKRGVFSHFLIEALKSPAVFDDEGRLTGSLLAARLKTDMLNEAKTRIPDPLYSPQNDIVFAKREIRPKVSLHVTFDMSIHGQTVELYGGKKYPDKESDHLADAGEWVVGLNPAIYYWKMPASGKMGYIPLDGKRERVDVRIS